MTTSSSYPAQNLSFLSHKVLHAVFSQTRPEQKLEMENLSSAGSVLLWLYKTFPLDLCMRFYKQPKFSRHQPASTPLPLPTFPDAPIAAFISSLFYYLQMSHSTV
jgi:hypothetical protein